MRNNYNAKKTMSQIYKCGVAYLQKKRFQITYRKVWNTETVHFIEETGDSFI